MQFAHFSVQKSLSWLAVLESGLGYAIRIRQRAVPGREVGYSTMVHGVPRVNCIRTESDTGTYTIIGVKHILKRIHIRYKIPSPRLSSIQQVTRYVIVNVANHTPIK